MYVLMSSETILEFNPFDIDYSSSDKAIRIFGTTADNKKVVALDEEFKNSFYVIINPKKEEKALEFLEKFEIKSEDSIIKPLDYNVVKKKMMGNPVTAVEITVENPKDVSILKDYIKEMPGYMDTAEDDIPFYKNYLLKNKIPMGSKIICHGKLIDTKKYNADFVISSKKIKVEGEHFEKSKIMAIDIETYNPKGNPRPSKDPVLMISISTNHDFNKVLTWKKFDKVPKYVKLFDSEVEILEELQEIIKQEKPDIIVGYNSDNFDFPYLEARADKYKMNLKLGTDKSRLFVRKKNTEAVAKINGIPHVDLFKFIRNMLSYTLKTETLDLNSVANELINEKKKEGINWEDIHKYWDEGDEKIKKLVEYSMHDSKITLKLAEKLCPSVLELSRIVGQSIFNVSRMRYGQCVEWFLSKNAHDFEELIPKKPYGKHVKGRFSRSYEGGYVHKPKPGLFENIVVYDFRSLYPSIIVSHNICPTTLFCDCCKEGHETPKIDGKTYTFCKKKKGFIPKLLEDLINRRIRIKEMLKDMKKDSSDYAILSARSYAIKTIANSSYGYYAFPRSRWYCIECAESITAWGRQYIKDVIEKAEKDNFNVLYADTDSAIITLKDKNLDKIKKFAEKINDELPGMMELEFEGFYPRGIFVAAKKRYALADEKGELTIKGLEVVRRDWSNIARRTQKKVLEAILIKGSKKKAVDIIREHIEALNNKEIPLEDVTILTQLTRKIKDYSSIGPHVAAAKKAEKQGYEFEPGQMIKYVVTKGGGSISERSYLLEEVKKKDMDYDSEYYINNQLLPAVERIFSALGVSKDELKGKIQKKLEGFFGD